VKTGNKRRAQSQKTRRSLSLEFSKALKEKTEKKLNVRQPKARRAPQAPMSFLLAALLVVCIAAAAFAYHLHVRFEGVWLGYETSRARAEHARLLVERRELRLELASLKSPGEVETEARERLGMEVPDHRRIIPIGKTLKPVLASGHAR
jgi:cell division protein FtsL